MLSLARGIAQSVWDVLHVKGVVTDLTLRPQGGCLKKPTKPL